MERDRKGKRSEGGYKLIFFSGAIKGGKPEILALLLFAGAEYEMIKSFSGISAKQYLLKLLSEASEHETVSNFFY
jgi:hypothetical protein